MTKCPHRADKDCLNDKYVPDTRTCQLCLMGQQIDELSLLTRELMNLSMDKLEREAEERLCREEQK